MCSLNYEVIFVFCFLFFKYKVLGCTSIRFRLTEKVVIEIFHSTAVHGCFQPKIYLCGVHE